MKFEYEKPDWGSESQEIKRFYHGDTITITF